MITLPVFDPSIFSLIAQRRPGDRFGIITEGGNAHSIMFILHGTRLLRSVDTSIETVAQYLFKSIKENASDTSNVSLDQLIPAQRSVQIMVDSLLRVPSYQHLFPCTSRDSAIDNLIKSEEAMIEEIAIRSQEEHIDLPIAE